MPVAYNEAFIYLFVFGRSYIEIEPAYLWVRPVLSDILGNSSHKFTTYTKNFKLFGIIFVQEGNRNAHFIGIITRNIRNTGNLNRIIIHIFGIIFCFISFCEYQFFMTLLDIKICIPANTFYANIFASKFVDSTPSRFKRIIIRDIKCPIPRMDAWANPHLIISQQWKYFLIGYCVYITDDNKFLFSIH